MTFTYRIAQDADAISIQSVKEAVWPEEATSEEQIRKAIAQPGHFCYLTLIKEKVIGFMDCFTTLNPQGNPRLELDLLAVLPEYRGLGIASTLIRHCLQHPAAPPNFLCRALIQIDNLGSQKSFQHNGFYCSPEVLNLYVKPNPAQSNAPTKIGFRGHLVAVTTLAYTGYWIEPPFSNGKLKIPGPFQTAGALLPEQSELSLIALQEGFEKINAYQWWTASTKE
jgi:ribosomal protein S18 acetylase RimI-like enzyme